MHPGDRTYRNQTVRLADLTVVTDVIEGVTFENCIIDGPAVLILQGCELRGTTLEGDLDACFWIVPKDREIVVGGVAMVNCTIVGSRLRRVGLAVPELDEQSYRQGFGG